jgi:hypothetical protein
MLLPLCRLALDDIHSHHDPASDSHTLSHDNLVGGGGGGGGRGGERQVPGPQLGEIFILHPTKKDLIRSVPPYAGERAGVLTGSGPGERHHVRSLIAHFSL